MATVTRPAAPLSLAVVLIGSADGEAQTRVDLDACNQRAKRPAANPSASRGNSTEASRTPNTSARVSGLSGMTRGGPRRPPMRNYAAWPRRPSWARRTAGLPGVRGGPGVLNRAHTTPLGTGALAAGTAAGCCRFWRYCRCSARKRARHFSQMPSVNRTLQPRHDAIPLSNGYPR
jgi:hypothetical protein